MKIIYLHQYFNTPEHSGGTRSYEIARRLVKNGHTVHMITSNRNRLAKSENGWSETVEGGIHVHWLAVPYSNHMPFDQRIRAFLRFAWSATNRAAAIQGDIIFATSTPLTIAIPAIYAAWRQKIPMVFEVRDLWPELPIAIGTLTGRIPIFLARQLEKFAYRYSSRIVTLSPGMKEGVLRSGYTSDRVSVIPNSSDIELFQVSKDVGQKFREQFPWLGDRPLVVYPGTLGAINGVSYLVYLAKAVKEIDPDIRFLVIGKGFEEDKVKNLAQELGLLNDNFFMFKPLPKREMPAVFSAADLVISLFINLPEMWANSANKFFDALASRTPVAINYQGWQADLLNETGSGIVLPPTDFAQAAQALVEFLSDKEQLREAGRNAYELACTKFHRDKLALELEGVLLATIKEANLQRNNNKILQLSRNFVNLFLEQNREKT